MNIKDEISTQTQINKIITETYKHKYLDIHC